MIKVNILDAQPVTTADNIVMSYDGFGRRIGITEEHGNTVLSSKSFIWCGPQICQERDSTGHLMMKQFYNLGEVINGIKYYYTYDHLALCVKLDETATSDLIKV